MLRKPSDSKWTFRLDFFHQGVDLNPPLSFTGLAGKTIGGDQVVKMNTYVNFRGSCAEAFRYYEKHLGAKVGMMMTHAQSPDQSLVKPEWKDVVLHARITIGDTELIAADIPNAEPMRSAYLTLRVDSDSKDTLHFYSPGAKPVSREDAPVSCYGTDPWHPRHKPRRTPGQFTSNSLSGLYYKYI
jgi:uncharacterized glyoxalase superfamily protein PhnB